MPTLDADLEPGEVLTVDGRSSDSLVKRASSSNEVAIGIVSTNPGLILSGEDLPKDRFLGFTLVALAGRVPVKATDENGEIKPGDHLTLSKTKPGYAMKQTEAGQSIGIALEKFEARNPKSETISNDQNSNIETGKILVFVNLSYWAPADAIFNFQSLITNNSSSSFSPSSSSSLPTLSLNSLFSSFLNQFKQLGIVFEKGILKVKRLFADEICLGETCINEEKLKALLELEKNQSEEPAASPPEVTATPSPTPSPSPETSPEPTPEASASPTPEPSAVLESNGSTESAVEPLSTPEPTPELESTPIE